MRTIAIRALLLSSALMVCAPDVRAQEPPPVIRALDDATAEGLEAAIAALRAHPERDALVASTVRDVEALSALSEQARLALLDIVEKDDVPYANSGLRDLVRGDGFSLPVRQRAAQVLGVRGTLADVSALGAAVSDLPEAASRALVSIGGRSAESALRKSAGESPPLAVRGALVRIGDRDQLRTLVDFIGDADSREEAVRQLRWATGRDLPPEEPAWRAYARRLALADELGHDDPERSRSAASGLAPVLRSRTSANLEDDLIALAGEEHWPLFARDKSALVLGLGRSTKAQPTLLALCKRRDDTDHGSLRLYSAEALARVGDLSSAVPLAAILVHDEDKDRIKARRGKQGEYFPVDPGIVRALTRMGCPGAVQSLVDLLAGDFRTRMHRDALRALREVTGGDDFGFEPDSSKPSRVAGHARIAQWWQDRRATLELAPSPDDAGWETFREHVAAEIEKLSQFKFLYQKRAKLTLTIVAEPALPQLVDALSHDVLHVRMGAAEVLALAAIPAAAEPLAACLSKEEKSPARTKLLRGIARCARPRPGVPTASKSVQAAVRRALDDRVLDVRIEAVIALRVVGDESDSARIATAAERPENDVPAFRTGAAATRLLLGDVSGLLHLLAEMRSGDVLRRTEAAAVLTAAGIDLQGYDPDATEAAREKALREIERVLEGERQ